MKKLESTLLNMFVVLTLISLISAGALAFTYGQTRPILAAQEQQAQIAAVAAVLPEFDNVPTEEQFSPMHDPELVVFPARFEDQRVGTAVRTATPSGYGGPITLMVGFDNTGAITGTSVLAHTETPGLGAKLTEAEFLDQFVGIDPAANPLVVAPDGGSIDAITAATISSRAFCEAAMRAYEAVVEVGGIE